MPRTQLTPNQRQFLADLFGSGDLTETHIAAGPSVTPKSTPSAKTSLSLPMRPPAPVPEPRAKEAWLDRFIAWLCR